MATLSIPGLTVTVPSYQWEYLDGRVFGTRNEGTTDYGMLHRQITGTIQRRMQVDFRLIDAEIEKIRRLAVRAGREAAPVIFTDEAGRSFIVDWPEAHDFQQMLDNRRGVELLLLEQSTGEPALPSGGCDVVSFQQLFLTTPLYPTDSPGGPSKSLPEYWQHPTLELPASPGYGLPVAGYPKLVIAEGANAIDGKLVYVDEVGPSGEDASTAAAVFMDWVSPGVVQPFFNSRTPGVLHGFAETKVTYDAGAWFGSANYALLLSIVTADQYQPFYIALNGVNATTGTFEARWDGWGPTSGWQTIVPDFAVASIFGTTDVWRMEWQAGSQVSPGDDPAMDGFLRVLRNGELVWEKTGFDLFSDSDDDTANVFGVAIGWYGFAGSHDYLKLGYSTC